jgi:hypothetical protein
VKDEGWLPVFTIEFVGEVMAEAGAVESRLLWSSARDRMLERRPSPPLNGSSGLLRSRMSICECGRGGCNAATSSSSKSTLRLWACRLVVAEIDLGIVPEEGRTKEAELMGAASGAVVGCGVRVDAADADSSLSYPPLFQSATIVTWFDSVRRCRWVGRGVIPRGVSATEASCTSSTSVGGSSPLCRTSSNISSMANAAVIARDSEVACRSCEASTLRDGLQLLCALETPPLDDAALTFDSALNCRACDWLACDPTGDSSEELTIGE